jgi:putative tryptophan/tyrosine transport system substrate-binding protein
MRRREFIAGLGSAAAWPVVARGQQRAMPVIVYFSAATREDLSSEAAAFRLGLLRGGFIDGRNVAIEYHLADNQFDRLPAMATGLVARRPAVIAAGPRAAQAAKAKTTTIPIVFWIGGDPVTLGLVDSISRPSGNVTGVSILSSEITAKRLGLMHQVIPTATTIGFLLDPNAGAADTVRRQGGSSWKQPWCSAATCRGDRRRRDRSGLRHFRQGKH